MSDTYKTRPYWVQIREPGRAREIHDHANGECTLPPIPTQVWNPNGCNWDWVWRLFPGCGCRMCTNYYGRKADRRASRRAARLAIRQERYDDIPMTGYRSAKWTQRSVARWFRVMSAATGT